MATYLDALLGCRADGWCRTIRTIRCDPRSHCLRRCFSHRLGSLQHCSGLDAATHKQLRSDRPGFPKQIEPKDRFADARYRAQWAVIQHNVWFEQRSRRHSQLEWATYAGSAAVGNCNMRKPPTHEGVEFLHTHFRCALSEGPLSAWVKHGGAT